jgi:hypothetical protein
VPESPEATIRAYLDAHGGYIAVPAHNLLTTWGLPHFDDDSRALIQDALESAGVVVQPDLALVDRDTQVSLSLRDEEPEDPPPPLAWTAESPPDRAANGQHAVAAPLTLPRLDESEETPSLAARFRRSIRGRRRKPRDQAPWAERLPAVAAGRPEASPDQCAVCGREREGNGSAREWTDVAALTLCPNCQAQGWRLPEAGGLPFRFRAPRS